MFSSPSIHFISIYWVLTGAWARCWDRPTLRSWSLHSSGESSQMSQTLINVIKANTVTWVQRSGVPQEHMAGGSCYSRIPRTCRGTRLDNKDSQHPLSTSQRPRECAWVIYTHDLISILVKALGGKIYFYSPFTDETTQDSERQGRLPKLT